MGAADLPETDEGFDDVTSFSSEAPPADRSHNRDTLSSEAMTEMLREVQDAMLALDERLATLASAQGAATYDTRLLARGVVDMGDALTRRVRALEQGAREPSPMTVQEEPAPPIRRPRTPPQHSLAWTAALVFVLVVVLGTFWLMAAESVDHASQVTKIRPPVVVAPTPAPAPAPAVANTTPVSPPRPPHTFTAFHHWTSARRTTVHTLPASNSTTATTGFGRYGPSPSTPAPASAPSNPPS